MSKQAVLNQQSTEFQDNVMHILDRSH